MKSNDAIFGCLKFVSILYYFFLYLLQQGWENYNAIGGYFGERRFIDAPQVLARIAVKLMPIFMHYNNLLGWPSATCGSAILS